MKKKLRDLDPQGRRVFLRADFNVPLDPATSKILSYERIDATIPTLRWLIDHGAKVVLVSHMGRPDGKYNPKLTLESCLSYLKDKLKVPVYFCKECVGPMAEYMSQKLENGEVLLLENIRFHEEEEKPTLEFCEKLARLAEDYVNDAFAVSHRRHASVWNLPKIFFPFRSYAGLQLEKEIETITKLLHNPSHPFSAIIGGSKISSKITLLSTLLNVVDDLLIGGAMCLPFLKAQGNLPHAIIDESQVQIAKQILESAKDKNKKIYLPLDFHCSDALSNPKYEVVTPEKITPQKIAFDVGEKTVEAWTKIVEKSKTIFWNGPVGAYEWSPYDESSRSLAKLLNSISSTIVVGGGDTVACFEGLAKKPNLFLSTGGGATLELLENGSLPGYDALSPIESAESSIA